jgi:hypothetical protein
MVWWDVAGATPRNQRIVYLPRLLFAGSPGLGVLQVVRGETRSRGKHEGTKQNLLSALRQHDAGYGDKLYALW